VIGTDFSGSTDFLTRETGYPVPYTLRPLRQGEYIYIEDQVWAEPDLGAAAWIMRDIEDRREAANVRGAEGQRFVKERYGRASVGNLIKDRLQTLGAC